MKHLDSLTCRCVNLLDLGTMYVDNGRKCSHSNTLQFLLCVFANPLLIATARLHAHGKKQMQRPENHTNMHTKPGPLNHLYGCMFRDSRKSMWLAPLLRTTSDVSRSYSTMISYCIQSQPCRMILHRGSNHPGGSSYPRVIWTPQTNYPKITEPGVQVSCDTGLNVH